MRIILSALLAILTVAIIPAASSATEPEYKTFEDLVKLQSPYKASIWQLERADVKLKFKMNAALYDSNVILLKGEAIVDPSTKEKIPISQIDEVPMVIEKADDFMTLLEKKSSGYCRIELFYPVNATEEQLNEVNDDSLWSVRSYRQMKASEFEYEADRFDVLLETKQADNLLAISRLSCSRPLPFVETANNAIGYAVSDIELIKQSFGENVQILVDTRKLEDVLTPE
ncbi:MAG: hypothetical protein KDD38_03520 [Bdellovibrionales bacterium]|nr:hypothetical protein [Bdellovibrionales bacterium]